MADGSGGASLALGMVVGALVVIVAVIGLLVYSGDGFGRSSHSTLDVNVKAPAISVPAPANQ